MTLVAKLFDCGCVVSMVSDGNCAGAPKIDKCETCTIEPDVHITDAMNECRVYTVCYLIKYLGWGRYGGNGIVIKDFNTEHWKDEDVGKYVDEWEPPCLVDESYDE